MSEEQADLLSYDRARDALAAGDDELVPFALLKRTQAGEHPVRVWRDHRGLTQRELARKAGITQSVLSKVETGKSDAQFTTMTRLSKALDIDVDDLVPPAD